MKKFLLSWVALCVSGFSFAHAAAEGFNPNEITYVVTMSANDKNVEEINAFSSFYHELVEGNEPSTLAWHFYRGSNDKIYLIERYENSGQLCSTLKTFRLGVFKKTNSAISLNISLLKISSYMEHHLKS